MQPKSKTYHVNSTTGNSHLHSSMLNSSNGNEKDRLTYQEKELYKALSQSKSTSSYASSIRQVCKEVERTGNINLFRELINTLIDMGQDNARLTKNIIGVKAYMVLSHFS